MARAATNWPRTPRQLDGLHPKASAPLRRELRHPDTLAVAPGREEQHLVAVTAPGGRHDRIARSQLDAAHAHRVSTHRPDIRLGEPDALSSPSER